MKKLFAILLAVLLGTLSVVTAASGDGAGAVTAGDTVTFGVFPQEENGKDQTPIEWIVLDVQDGKALLISKYGLDARPCVKISDYRNLKDVTWEDCELRAWLNETFLRFQRKRAGGHSGDRSGQQFRAGLQRMADRRRKQH